MVHEQGEVVDSIEANVGMAQEEVSKGTQQLAKARSYQVTSKCQPCYYLYFHLNFISCKLQHLRILQLD